MMLNWLPSIYEPFLSKAREIFANTGVTVTTEGMTVLGVPIGTDTFVKNAILKKVSTWSNELAEIADTHPHAAFSAFGHGFSSRWTGLYH